MQEKQRKEKRERLERIKREREEREVAEAADGKTSQQVEEDEEDGVVSGDPFKNLDDHLKTKDLESSKKGSAKKKKGKHSEQSKTPPETPEHGRVTPTGSNGSAEGKAYGREDSPALGGSPSGHVPALAVAEGDSLFKKPSTINRAPSPRPAPFGEGYGGLPTRLPPLGGALPPLGGSTPLKPIDALNSKSLDLKYFGVCDHTTESFI